MMRVIVMAAFAALVTLVGDGCDGQPPPECSAPTATARLDVETCVDRQDLGICRWADPDITSPDHVSGCAAPNGVVCVETCPPNHYDTEKTP